MNTNLAARLAKLEAEIKARQGAGIWIDANNNRVRVDIAGKRGEELTFDNPRVAMEWLNERIKPAESINGIISQDDITELFEGELQSALQAAMVEGEDRGVCFMRFTQNQGVIATCYGFWLQGLGRRLAGSPNKRDRLTGRGGNRLAALAVLAAALNVPFPELTADEQAQLFENATAGG
jgi:hypothetical protein